LLILSNPCETLRSCLVKSQEPHPLAMHKITVKTRESVVSELQRLNQ
jgi:hypothetical protein